ncbi:MAG: phosphotransferase family protein, partial [Acidimicrobiaceae bacterium]|nr:phosphotransferase family protein [Acidimicrobiaceae bacterium]
ARHVSVTGMERPGGGYSAETWLVDTEVDGTSHRFVVKRETPDPPIYPTQVPGLLVEVEIQHRIMDALSRCEGVPVAPLVGYENDPAVLGRPFFAMEYVPGVILTESPPYTASGPFIDASEAVRREMVESGLRVLAAMHDIAWERAGLGWLAPEGEASHTRQLRIWEDWGHQELRGRDHPDITEGLRWLHAHQPRCGPPVFNWGDSRLGNIIFDGARCVCTMDFEGACIAPPEVDLGWWLFFDRTMHEGAHQERAPGNPTRAEQLEIYAQLSGRDLGDVHWFEVLAGVKYAVIVVRVMNRSVDRGEIGPESDFWRTNSIVDCLAEVVGQ